MNIKSNYFKMNKEIMEETKVSKRTLICSLDKIKEKIELINTKFGRIDYHKMKINDLISNK